MKRGWFKDSFRHSLAARGIKTRHSYLKKATKRRPLSERQLERNVKVLQMSAALNVGELPSGQSAETEAKKREEFAARSVARSEGVKSPEVKAEFLQKAFESELEAEDIRSRGSKKYEDLSKAAKSAQELLDERRRKKLQKLENELESLRFETTVAEEKTPGTKGEVLEDEGDSKTRVVTRGVTSVEREIKKKEEEAQRLRESLGESDITAFGDFKTSWLKGVAKTLGDVGASDRSGDSRSYDIVSKRIRSPQEAENFANSIENVYDSLEPDEQRKILLEFKKNFKRVNQEEVKEIGENIKKKIGVDWDEVQE